MTEHCGICIKTYKTLFEKFYHYDVDHNEFCPICDNKIDGGKVAKVIHLQFHAASPCTHCWRIFENLTEFNAHIENPRTHLYRCQKCRLDFNSNSDMWIHYEQQHSSSCIFCSHTFNSDSCNKLCRDEHYKNTHSMFPCSICYEIFMYQAEHTDHVDKKHRVSCTDCNDTFSDLNSKELHYANIHQVHCTICQRRFNTQFEYQVHYNDIHRIRCDACDETFPDEEVAKRHNDRLHNHFCRSCKQIFNSEMALQCHIAMEHEWKCLFCNGLYESEAIRHRHIQVVHQFPCPVCNMVLDTQQAKDEHVVLLHQMKCDVCDKDDMTFAQLLLHYNVVHQLEYPPNIDDTSHDGNRIQCSVCNERFDNELCLCEHYRCLHINFCDYCDDDFQYVDQLLKHKLSLHEE